MKDEIRKLIIEALASSDKEYTTEEWCGALLFCANLLNTSVESVLSDIISFHDAEQEYIDAIEQEQDGQHILEEDYETRQEEYYYDFCKSNGSARFDD